MTRARRDRREDARRRPVRDARGDRQGARRQGHRCLGRPPRLDHVRAGAGPGRVQRAARRASSSPTRCSTSASAARTVLSPEEARTALAARYVASHGPVTVNDFVWWSGLTVGEAKRAFEAVSPALRTETIDEHTYWSSPIVAAGDAARRAVGAPAAELRRVLHRLPRSQARRRRCCRRARRPIRWTASRTCCASRAASAASGGGRSARARWRCSCCPTGRSSRAHVEAAEEAAERYAAFLGLPLEFSVRPPEEFQAAHPNSEAPAARPR